MKEAASVCTQLHAPTQVHEGDLKFTFPPLISATVSSQAHAKLHLGLLKIQAAENETGKWGYKTCLCCYPGWKGMAQKLPAEAPSLDD